MELRMRRHARLFIAIGAIALLFALFFGLPMLAAAEVKVCFYSPQNSLWSGWNYQYFHRQEADGSYLVDRLVLYTTYPSTIERVKRERPGIELLGVSDLSFLLCKTDAQARYWSGWADGDHDEARMSANPDLRMARVYRDAYSRGWNGIWYDGTGKWIAAQPHDCVADPIAKLPPGGTYGGMRPLQAWAQCYAGYFPQIYHGFVIDMTPGRLTWVYHGVDLDLLLDDRLWLWQYGEFAAEMNRRGIPWYENSWGAGPRNIGTATGYKLENWGNQTGQSGAYEGFGYLCPFRTSLRFADGTVQNFASGLATLTEAQRAQSMIVISPRKTHSEAMKHQLLVEGLTAAQIMGVGYVAINSHFRSDDGPWDPHALYPAEIERMLRLEPIGPAEWRRGRDRSHVELEAPDAWTAMTYGDMYVRRKMRDPATGRTCWLALNPNNELVADVIPGGPLAGRSGRLVSTTGRAIEEDRDR